MSTLNDIDKANWDEFRSAHRRFLKNGGFHGKPVGPRFGEVFGRAWRVASKLNRIQRLFEVRQGK